MHPAGQGEADTQVYLTSQIILGSIEIGGNSVAPQPDDLCTQRVDAGANTPLVPVPWPGIVSA